MGDDSQNKPRHIPDKNYFKLDRRLLRYWLPAIGAPAVIIYEIIVDCFNESKGYSWPTFRQIERATGFGNRTVQKAMKTLKDNGLIKVWRGSGSGGHGRANRYVPLPAEVTDETIQLIKERGYNVIIDSLHLLKDTNSQVLDDTTTETEDTNPDQNGECTDVKQHEELVSNDMTTEILKETDKSIPIQQQDKEDIFMRDKHNTVVVQEKEGVSHIQKEEVTAEEKEAIKYMTASLKECYVSGAHVDSDDKISNAIAEQIYKHGLKYVADKLLACKDYSRTHHIVKPIACFRTACSRNWTLDTMYKSGEKKELTLEEQLKERRGCLKWLYDQPNWESNKHLEYERDLEQGYLDQIKELEDAINARDSSRNH